MHLKCFFKSREKCFMEPLKKVQVEGLLMFAEPQDLLGNLDELCYVCIYFFSYPSTLVASSYVSV